MLDTVELKLISICEIVGKSDVGIIVLHDKDDKQQIAVVCDKLIEQELQMRVMKKKECNTMLPEILVNLLKQRVSFNYEIVINDIIDGTYRAMLIDTDTYQPTSLRASDAILLHEITKVPIYATRQLMHRQGVPVIPNTPAMSLPYNALSDSMLKDALEACIKQENYETASSIRDELKRRGVQ